MSYGSNEKTELKENNYFVAGINQNATITAEFRSPKKDGTGDKILCIDLLGEKGQKFTITEWPGQDEPKIKNQLTRLRRWVKEVTGEDSFPTMFPSFEEMANVFITIVSNKPALLEFKLVYNDKGYLEMPKYDGCVRAMSNPSRLTLSSSEQEKTTKAKIDPTADVELMGTATDELGF